MRYRRRRAAGAAMDWESVRGSAYMHSNAGGAGAIVNPPRTPSSSRSTRSRSNSTRTVPSPHTPQMAQYAVASGMLSPTRPSTAHSNISPRLMIQTAGHGSLESIPYEMVDSDDPFADPVAVARRRPIARASLSPTIRTSDMTLVEGGARGSLWQGSAAGSIDFGKGTSALKNVPEYSPVDAPARNSNPFLDPAPALMPAHLAAGNRLSNASSQPPPSPSSDAVSTP